MPIIKTIVFVACFILGWFSRTWYVGWRDRKEGGGFGLRDMPSPGFPSRWIGLYEAVCKKHGHAIRIPYMKETISQEAEVTFQCGCKQTITLPAAPEEEVFVGILEKERRERGG